MNIREYSKGTPERHTRRANVRANCHCPNHANRPSQMLWNLKRWGVRFPVSRLAVPLLAVIALSLPLPVWGKAPATLPTRPDAGWVALAGSNSPGTGLVETSAPVAVDREMSISLQFAIRNRPSLDRLLHDLYDPASPLFHHFLTPRDFSHRFGPTTATRSAACAVTGRGIPQRRGVSRRSSDNRQRQGWNSRLRISDSTAARGRGPAFH